MPSADVWATDSSPAALALARDNARRHGVHLHCVESSWFAQLAGERFDVIVSNPPYVAEGDEHLEHGDLRYEPPAALVGGADGLDCIRRIIAEAKVYLMPGGWLLLEHGYDQAERVRSLLGIYGYLDAQSLPDLAGIPRIAGARSPD
jgi:release factor glutamine methyltransferase